MLLKLNHIFFAFHTILPFQALILCALFNLNLPFAKPIQKMEELFIECPLWEKLKISLDYFTCKYKEIKTIDAVNTATIL